MRRSNNFKGTTRIDAALELRARKGNCNRASSWFYIAEILGIILFYIRSALYQASLVHSAEDTVYLSFDEDTSLSVTFSTVSSRHAGKL